MPSEIQLLTALLFGLSGAVHCAGMCGGIVGALTFTLTPEHRASFGRTLPFLLAYNLGRITSYAAAGALMGGLGAAATGFGHLQSAQAWLAIVAALFMLALGLYLGGWWQGLVHLERAGGRLWRRVEPYGRRLLPVRGPGQAWLLGLLWGWLPCGLVYSVLVWALAAGSPAGGALLMATFGLGTLPALLAMGAAAGHLARLVRKREVRWAAGALVLVFAALQLWRGLDALG